MNTISTADNVLPLAPGGNIATTVPVGTVVDHWGCPCCERVLPVVRRAGRPRIYCSQACRQRAYRWRQQHGAHTVSTATWPAEKSFVHGGRHHALRGERDPLSRRRDRRGREVTACGALAYPAHGTRSAGYTVPFLGAASSSACCSCATLTTPRPLGLVPPGSIQPADISTATFGDSVRALRAISQSYPLEPGLRHLVTTSWAAA